MSEQGNYPFGEVKVLWYGKATYNMSYKKWRSEKLKKYQFLKEETVPGPFTLLYLAPKKKGGENG